MSLESQKEAHEFWLDQGGYDTETGVPDSDYVAFSYYIIGETREVHFEQCREPWRFPAYDAIERYSVMPVLGVSNALALCEHLGGEETLKAELPAWALAVAELAESAGFGLLPPPLATHCQRLAESYQRFYRLRGKYRGLNIYAPDNARAAVLLCVGKAANGLDPIIRVFDEEEDRMSNDFGWTSRFAWRIDHQFGASNFQLTLEMLNEFHTNLAALYEIFRFIHTEGGNV